MGERPCSGRVNRDAMEELVQRAVSSISAVTGEYPSVGSGSTDCNIPLSMGIPAVCFGGLVGDGGSYPGGVCISSRTEAGSQDYRRISAPHHLGLNGASRLGLISHPVRDLQMNSPDRKKTAIRPTAILMVPPANFTAAMTSEPRKEAPFEKIS